MRRLLVLLLGLSAGYAYGFYDGRHNAEPTVLRMMKSFKHPSLGAVQRAESLKTDAEGKLERNASEKTEAGR